MRNKRKGIVLAASILGSIAIVSTGFASWVISAPSSAIENGSIKVENVDDKRVVLTPTLTTKTSGSLDDQVVFGTPETTGSSGWLTNTSIGKQNLEFTLSVTAVYKDGRGAKPTGNISVTFTPSKTIADDTLIKVPTFTPATKALSEGSASFDVTFGWGTKFESTNPYTYYNAKDPNGIKSETTTWADDAKANLTALYDLVNGMTFTLTVAYTA
ncbi:MAG: hypothetical protein MR270_07770 [Erysipelotrichaceae bacterium]|nr:hypothetical protein [Erysipelotrichaceae bacterium]